ncbi:unnamed protein product, partial [Symbiodinium sp. CCMP2456]
PSPGVLLPAMYSVKRRPQPNSAVMPRGVRPRHRPRGISGRPRKSRGKRPNVSSGRSWLLPR